MKWIKRLGVLLFILYALACVALYFTQERILFNPDTLPQDFVFSSGEEVELEVEKGISINCLWLKEPGSKGAILYLHGNRGSNRRCLHQAETMQGKSYDIFMPDYRGYGKSDGLIVSEKQLFNDAQKAYDFLKQHYQENQIVVVGYSIGSGIASYLAANNQPQQLILLAPYCSMVDMKNRTVPLLPDFLLKYPLRTDEYLQKTAAPITLFHGLQDDVIPVECSEDLKALKPDAIQLITMQEGHRGVIFSHIFRERMGELLMQGLR